MFQNVGFILRQTSFSTFLEKCDEVYGFMFHYVFLDFWLEVSKSMRFLL